MNFIKEIWDRSLPNFGYVIDTDRGGQYVVVLGGQGVPKGSIRHLRDAIVIRNEQMQRLYEQEVLTDDPKKELALQMRKMYALCECREEGLYSREEQSAFIDKLTANEKEQLQKQIQMLKDCREFFREYVF